MSIPAYTLDDLNVIVKEGIRFSTLESIALQPQYYSSSSQTNGVPPPDPGDDQLMMHGTIKIPMEVANKYKFADNNLQAIFYSMVHPVLSGTNPNYSLNNASVYFYVNDPMSAMNGNPVIFSMRNPEFLEASFSLTIKLKCIANIASNIASVGFYKVLEEELSKD